MDQLKKAFFYDLTLYRITKKVAYLKCAMFTLDKIKKENPPTYNELKKYIMEV